MTIEDIRKWGENFEADTGSNKYDRHPTPEVTAYYKAYLATGAYPYLKSVASYIFENEKMAIPQDDEHATFDHLKTQVFLAECRYRDEKNQKQDAELMTQGWTKISRENYKTIPLRVNAEILIEDENFLGLLRTQKKGRFTENGFLPSRCRRKGYSMNRLIGAHYRLQMTNCKTRQA